MEKLTPHLAELLYSRFAAIYVDKFIKAFHDKKFISLWCEEWISGLHGIDPRLIKGALEECKLTLDWPPTIREFRKLCEKGAGFPSYQTCFDCAIRQDFTHPIIYLAYQKVGRWAIQNDKEDILRKKFEIAYSDALTEYRQDNLKAHKLLEDHLVKPKQIESNTLTYAEVKSFKETLKIYQEQAKIDKANLPNMSHPNWEPNHFNKDSKSFKEDIFKERRRYLLNLTDREAATLSMDDWYDRVKYCRELEGIEHLNRIGYNGKE